MAEFFFAVIIKPEYRQEELEVCFVVVVKCMHPLNEYPSSVIHDWCQQENVDVKNERQFQFFILLSSRQLHCVPKNAHIFIF